ncbi:macrophage migration inhibitory factor-like isoform X1 [Acipenser ruthenus]|uniref:macrophage migration inhibitory factor-like isoform X1 n=1 Tax=Acipenser ruthenus TaxID=7906 RepID=UPI00145B0E2D|nr:macrophage migration inhibitory factor-like isoform X1 [Acipenser ruthenus]
MSAKMLSLRLCCQKSHRNCRKQWGNLHSTCLSMGDIGCSTDHICLVQYIAVHIATDQMMMFGGKPDPCALCSLHSIGKISGQENKLYSKLLCGLINKHLGISVDRIYINFVDMDAENVGWSNSTFG